MRERQYKRSGKQRSTRLHPNPNEFHPNKSFSAVIISCSFSSRENRMWHILYTSKLLAAPSQLQYHPNRRRVYLIYKTSYLQILCALCLVLVTQARYSVGTAHAIYEALNIFNIYIFIVAHHNVSKIVFIISKVFTHKVYYTLARLHYFKASPSTAYNYNYFFF